MKLFYVLGEAQNNTVMCREEKIDLVLVYDAVYRPDESRFVDERHAIDVSLISESPVVRYAGGPKKCHVS